MYKPKFKVDLHAHTTRSDGNDTPLQFIDRAAKLGMKVMAIADHDVIPPEYVEVNNKQVEIVEYAKSKKLELVLGSEISCDTYNEDVHLLAFGCDWNHEKISELTASIVRSKLDAYKELVEILKKEGMDITWDELLYNNGNPIMEDEIQKKMIFNLLAEKGYFPSWKDAKLMTQKNENMNVRRKKPDPVDIIELIHELGGIVVCAHPFLINPDFKGLCNYLEPLLEAGLDGIEASYPYSKTNFKGNGTDEELKESIINKFGKKGLFISGGSDYHGEWRKGVSNPREMGEAGISYQQYRDSILYDLLNK